MSKQDRQGARTASDLEQRYQFGKTFAEVMGIASDARDLAEYAKKSYEGLNQEEIFKRLTNNGVWQGMYEENGQVYINASYIKSGEFLADLIKAGVLQSVDGETFKLDLDNGQLVLKSGGYEVMNVGADGAKISGWEIKNDYLGQGESGINGNVSVYGTSEKAGISMLRFFSGASDSTTRQYVTFQGFVTAEGYFEASEPLNYMAANNLNVMVLSITSRTNSGNLSLTENDFATNQPLTIHKTAINVLSASGKLTNTAAYLCPMTVQISYDSFDPAFQVLDDGTLIAKHAKIGGYSIDDLVRRIEALEGK